MQTSGIVTSNPRIVQPGHTLQAADTPEAADALGAFPAPAEPDR